MQVILLDLSYNYITNIPSIFFSHYPNMRHLNLAGNLLKTISSTDEWKIIKSLKVLEFKGNNFVCNCSGLELKETLVWLNARPRTTVEDLNQIKCSLPSSVKDKVIYDLPTSSFGCPFVNLVLIFTLTLSLLLFLSIVILIAYIFFDTTSTCFYLYILDGDLGILTQKKRHSMMLLYRIRPKTVIG